MQTPTIYIYIYHIYSDHIELWHPGGIMTITDQNDIKQIKEWISEADRWIPHNTNYIDTICNYITYQIGNEW